MKILIFFVLISLCSSIDIVLKRSCISKCFHIGTGQKICASDRKLYTDLCRARCNNSSLHQLFQCHSHESVHDCRYRCHHYQVLIPVYPPPPITIHPPTPIVSSKIDYCLDKCDVTSSDHAFCATNRKVYKSYCHAKCRKKHLKLWFYCSEDLSLKSCRHTCKYSEYHVYPVVPHVPKVPTPITIPRPCYDSGLVCASNGHVYNGNCSYDFNSSIHVLFNCKANKLHSKRACRKICNRYHHSHCLNNCVSTNTPYCYSNGKVMNNNCLAGCMGHNQVFTCGGYRRKSCSRMCRRYLRKTTGAATTAILIGSAKPK